VISGEDCKNSSWNLNGQAGKQGEGLEIGARSWDQVWHGEDTFKYDAARIVED